MTETGNGMSEAVPKRAMPKTAGTRVIYDSASGELFYDANGSKKGGSVLVATLDDALALDASHFLVI